MADIYISEYKEMAKTIGQKQDLAAAQEPALAVQKISISGASTQCAAFNEDTRFIEIHTDAICSIAFGLNPTATTSSKRMAANQTQFFGVVPSHKVAVISNT
jgi:hypothetical protein